MTPQEYANRLILLRVLRAKVDAADKALRAQWREHLAPGDRSRPAPATPGPGTCS